jgi:hypothetical protein
LDGLSQGQPSTQQIMAQIRQPAWPHYLIAASLVVFPLYEAAASNLIPIRLQDPRWRFTAFGVLSPSLLIATLGIMVAFWVANSFEHRRFQRVFGIWALATSAVLAVLVLMFALDVLQVRGGVRQEAATAFHAASVVAAGRVIVCGLAIAGLGISALRAAKASRLAEAQRGGGHARETAPLIGVRPAPPGVSAGAGSSPAQ